jgi:hypothetical protein
MSDQDWTPNETVPTPPTEDQRAPARSDGLPHSNDDEAWRKVPGVFGNAKQPENDVVLAHSREMNRKRQLEQLAYDEALRKHVASFVPPKSA